MALSKSITLDNGIEARYHVVSAVNTVNKEAVRVILDSFSNKSIYSKAMTKFNLIKEQDELIVRLEELNTKEDLSKTEEKELTKTANRINEISTELETTKEYKDLVLFQSEYMIEYSEDLSLSYIENHLSTLEAFSNSEIID